MRKKYFILIFLLSMSKTELIGQEICNMLGITIFSDSPICNDNPWVLVFEDNFDGTELDLEEKWSINYQGVSRDFQFENEKQWWANTGTTPYIDYSHNIEVSNGTLKLITRKEDPPIWGIYTNWETTPPSLFSSSFNYSSAEILTKEKFLYGKFEISCKIPMGSFWPAFWLYGDWDKFNEKDKNNEIDIFEFYNSLNKFSSNVHYDFNGNGNTASCAKEHDTFINFATSFNTFTMIWDEYSIKWYLNNNCIRTVNRYFTLQHLPVNCEQIIDGLYYSENVFGFNPMQVILNTSVFSENNPKNPIPDDNDLPAYYEIDYVRIWQKAEQEPICCNTHKLYEATDNLPALTSVDNYIKADFDVGIPGISGNVVVKNGQDVTFRAGDFIELTAGFEVEPGANFSSEIAPCTSSNGDNIVIYSFPDSFNPFATNNNKLFIDVSGATHYKVRVESKNWPYNTFYFTEKIPIYTNPVAIWDGSCNYSGNCWFYIMCDKERRVIVKFYNCENQLLQTKIVEVDCGTKSSPSSNNLMTENDDSNGKVIISMAGEVYALNLFDFQIHPNPFSDSFTISISQSEQTDAKIYLTDAYGRQVLGIFSGSFGKGQHSIDVSTAGITKGLYFCIMETKTDRKVVKVVKLE